jgi:hypothetical protein
MNALIFSTAQWCVRIPVRLGKDLSDKFAFRTVWHKEIFYQHKTKLNSVALVSERTIPTERPQLVGEVSAKSCG